MSFEPTPFQALLLFGLLARHGACKQAELVPAIAAKDRDALAAAKLVAVKKIGRTFHLDLTDAGWGWAGAHLAAELPPAHRTLHDWLTRLSEHFARSGDTLAEFVGAKPGDAVEADARKALEEKRRAAEEKAERLAREKREKEEARAAKQQATEERKRLAAENAERIAREKEEKAKAKEAAKDAAEEKRKAAAEAKKQAPPAKKRSAPEPKPPTPAALRKRIGEAYLAITGGKTNESVKLARLRTELADLDRPTLDAALGRILQGDEKASLMRHDDPRQIDKADEAAAYSPAGEPFHVLWIAS